MTAPAVSFRDPAGACCVVGQRVLRVLTTRGATELEAFLRTPSAAQFMAARQLVSTQRLTAAEVAALQQALEWKALFAGAQPDAVFEHERIAFRSYPYEWPPEMLWEAGRLTLELAQAALQEGYGLKDATPYNILFRGSDAVFVDVPSFEARVPGDPLWQAYGQFVRTFLLPLLANRRWGLSLADIFTARREGFEPQEIYRLCGAIERFNPQVLSLVSMPTWLRGKARAEGEQLYATRVLSNKEKAAFIVKSLLSRLQRSLNSLKPTPCSTSVWSDYMRTHSYTEPAFAAKESFIDALLQEFKPQQVLDAGANTGHFSLRAAKAGAQVVAMDLDPVCVGMIWQQASQQALPVLPLVVNLARPSPPLGWCNAECPSFLDRVRGRFDAVFMLALVHHLLVTDRIPLPEVLRLAAELTTSLLVIEYVPPEDPMFRQLTRGREKLHQDLNQRVFEEACARQFDILRAVALPGTQRRLYALRKRAGAR
jgi:predicted RNA methylase